MKKRIFGWLLVIVLVATPLYADNMSDLDALRYIASHGDLIEAFGADPAKGRSHYEQWGIKEGRKITFEPVRYMASHADLIQAFKGDELKATTHYIQFGYKERRQTTFSDLDALQYLASYGDLIQAFGSDVLSGIRHYVSFGYQEGRRAFFDALAYIASHGDLIAAFGTDAVAGAKHYINWGYKEGRQVVFDALGYLARHTDLQQAFGSDTVAATKHYINWGFKEGRQYSFTVTVRTSSGGVVSKSRAYVPAGERETFLFTPATGYYLAAVSGCNGTLNQNTYTTGPIARACNISAEFKLSFEDISGTVSAFDTSRPAFVTLVSADDDSVLEVKPVGVSGAFKFTNLDARKKYYVDVEQSGRRPSSAVIEFGSLALSANAPTGMIEKISQFFGGTIKETVRPFAVQAAVGDAIQFTTEAVPGLTENEYRFYWAYNGTPSGESFSTRVPNPVVVEKLADQAALPDAGAASRLAEEFGIVLVNPDSTTKTPSGSLEKTLAIQNQMYWTDEYADRLYSALKVLPIDRYAGSVRTGAAGELQRGKWISSPTYVALTSREIRNDVESLTKTYRGGKVVFAASAFANATPKLVRIEGKRGVLFSSRLWRASLRFASENGVDFQFLKNLMKIRYGVVVAAPGENPLVTTPSGCSSFPTECSPTSWRAFSSEELLSLATVYEEFPDPLKDISNPGGKYGLRYILRRQDGTVNPGNTKAAAAYDVRGNYAEYMEAAFAADPDLNRLYKGHAHEKAHAIWSTVLDSQTRLDWLRLSGWYFNPKTNGGNAGSDGQCDLWRRNPSAWVPPGLSSADLDFLFGVLHDESKSDINLLSVGWGSCDTENFVSAYSGTNPNEDFAEAFGNFLFNPDLVRSKAPKKYEFLRDRLMQGTVFISKIREDLTFPVLNLYPDQSYPGSIKKVDVSVKGAANQDKELTVRIEVETATCMSKNAACFSAVRDGKILASSRYLGPYENALGIILTAVSANVLEGRIPVSKYKPAGWYSVGSLSITDQNNNSRTYYQASQQFAMRIYINNSLEDTVSAKYIKDSAGFQFVSRAHPEAQSDLPSDETELVASWRVVKAPAPVIGCIADAVIPKRTSEVDIGKAGSFAGVRLFGVPVVLPSGQPDGATHQCLARHRFSKFMPSGEYQLIATRTDDAAGNVLDVRYSSDGAGEPLLKASFSSEFSDEIAPFINIQTCTTDAPSEACLRIVSAPTNPTKPNGETLVTLSYFAFDAGPLSKASGFSKGNFVLRDPAGRVYTYISNCPHQGQPEFTGIESRCPPWPYETGENDSGTLGGLKRVYWNRVFKCPESAAAPCDALTPVQYQARVLLPVGSVAGTWGLIGMTVYDKAENFRSYDFTELFRFVPLSSSAPARMSAFGASGTSDYFGFTVVNSIGKARDVIQSSPKVSAELFSSAVDAQNGSRGHSGVWSATSGWFESVGASADDLLSRVDRWWSARFADRRSAVADRWTSSPIAQHLLNASARTKDRLFAEVRDGVSSIAVSESEDSLSGSVYRVIRGSRTDESSPQQWNLEYRSNTGALFSSGALPSTSEVLWRERFAAARLPTAGWVRVCGDRVWTFQDGYSLLFHVSDRSLQGMQPGQLWVKQSAEATVVTDVRCTFGGGVRVEGYAFDVSGDEPPLRRGEVPATRFGFALDRLGGLMKRDVHTAPFNLEGLCATAPANENQMFCSQAKKTVGW